MSNVLSSEPVVEPSRSSRRAVSRRAGALATRLEQGADALIAFASTLRADAGRVAGAPAR